jgi:hypothetical protein
MKMSFKTINGKFVDFPSHRLVHATCRDKKGRIEEFLDPVDFMTDEEVDNEHWIYYPPSELGEIGVEPFEGAEYYAVGYGDLVACDPMMEQIAVYDISSGDWIPESDD